MQTAKFAVVCDRFAFPLTLTAAEQDISNRRYAAMMVRALQSETEAPANPLRAKQLGIDAGGSVARPESTILIKWTRYLSGTQAEKMSRWK